MKRCIALSVGLVLSMAVIPLWADSDPHAGHRAAMQQTGYAVTTVDYAVPDVMLLNQAGDSVGLRDILKSDKPVALNFIFTTCSTVCPVMTATFAQMQRELGASADELLLVSVSIDPEFDRPAVLQAYAYKFDATDNWTFLTGDSDEVTQVLTSFDSYAGSKMNHQPVTLLRGAQESSWVRIDGLASGADLAHEVTANILN